MEICPGISFTVNVLSKHVNAPTVTEWKLVIHLIRYPREKMGTGIRFTKNNSSPGSLVGLADANYSNSAVTKPTTSGFVATLYGNPISWSTKKQAIVSQLTTEPEFVAINKCAEQLRWLSML
ncbi:hypothetical protein O181_073393 [Austropuccinia psidii MF-1]|uniref:Reverse transcriptase Ty1/copia-type domain-containing protein n=1 Tax=Austropuccinia psidii MF-1 TaxID=1389203 RepID=A0A9Q3IA05_9BASI|nr:hypothetical protein [Austropuccinia psidii MF-1]